MPPITLKRVTACPTIGTLVGMLGWGLHGVRPGDFDASTTYAVFAPKGTPPEVVDKLYAEIKRALDEEVVQRKFRAAGVEPKLGTPSEITKLLESQIMQWADVIRSGAIKID
jgi:hypothetical protein